MTNEYESIFEDIFPFFSLSVAMPEVFMGDYSHMYCGVNALSFLEEAEDNQLYFDWYEDKEDQSIIEMAMLSLAEGYRLAFANIVNLDGTAEITDDSVHRSQVQNPAFYSPISISQSWDIPSLPSSFELSGTSSDCMQ